MSGTKKIIINYRDSEGKEPFAIWFSRIRDLKIRYRILDRIERIADGNYGDFKSVGDGVYELRMFFGPGNRVYFGEDSDRIIILLCGGDKSSQRKDIRLAKDYWKEYQSHE